MPMKTGRIFPVLTIALLLSLAPFTSAQDWAKTRLDASPRHHEYVTLKHGDRSVQALPVVLGVGQFTGFIGTVIHD